MNTDSLTDSELRLLEALPAGTVTTDQARRKFELWKAFGYVAGGKQG